MLEWSASKKEWVANELWRCLQKDMTLTTRTAHCWIIAEGTQNRKWYPQVWWSGSSLLRSGGGRGYNNGIEDTFSERRDETWGVLLRIDHSELPPEQSILTYTTLVPVAILICSILSPPWIYTIQARECGVWDPDGWQGQESGDWLAKLHS